MNLNNVWCLDNSNHLSRAVSIIAFHCFWNATACIFTELIFYLYASSIVFEKSGILAIFVLQADV